MIPETSAAIYDEITVSGLRLYQIAALLVVLLPGALAGGLWFGQRQLKRVSESSRGAPSVMSEGTQAAFQALLGLVLAFTFGNALTVSQAIKGSIANEAAAIGTAFLRADYVPEPGRTELKQALLIYAKTRVAPADRVVASQEDTQQILETSLRAQAKLWPITLSATKDTSAPIQTFVASAMNAVIDAHTFRVSALSVPVTAVTQEMLLLGAIATMFIMGNRAALVGQSLTWRDFAFAFFLCAVMYSIVDIRRPREGLITADDSVMRATIFDMEQALTPRG